MKKMRNEMLWMLGALVLFGWCIGLVHGQRAHVARKPAGKNDLTAVLVPTENFLEYIHHFLRSRSVDRINEILVTLPPDEALKRAWLIIKEQNHDLIREDELQLIAALASHYKTSPDDQKKIFELLLFDPVYYQHKENEEPFGFVMAAFGYAEILPALQAWSTSYTVKNNKGEQLASTLLGDFIGDAIRHAVRKEMLDSLQAMRQAGVSISKELATDLLLMATQLSNFTGRTVEFLKLYGANLDAVDVSGKTPLIYAVENNNLKLTQELLKAGAQVNFMPSPEVGTALQRARTLSHVELESLLRKHGSKD